MSPARDGAVMARNNAPYRTLFIVRTPSVRSVGEPQDAGDLVVLRLTRVEAILGHRLDVGAGEEAEVDVPGLDRPHRVVGRPDLLVAEGGLERRTDDVVGLGEPGVEGARRRADRGLGSGGGVEQEEPVGSV